jgi:general secretion pathway protein D
MRLFFLISLAFSMSAMAADEDKINVQLDAVRLSELIKIGYAEVLNTGYIADDAFITDPRAVTFRITSMSKEELKQSVNHLLDMYSYKLERIGKTLFISKKPDGPERVGDKRPFYYQPRYRSVRYISDLVASIFTNGTFTFQRQVQNSSNTVSSTSSSGSASRPSLTQENTKNLDTGTNAYSQIAKDSDAFFFYGTDKEIDQLQALLVQIDKPQGEVVVKAIIYEVTNTENKQTAFNAAVNLLTLKLSLNINASSLTNTLSLKVPGI